MSAPTQGFVGTYILLDKVLRTAGATDRSKDIHVFAILIGHDGLIVDQHRVVVLPAPLAPSRAATLLLAAHNIGLRRTMAPRAVEHVVVGSDADRLVGLRSSGC
jgi:hypothetical protein